MSFIESLVNDNLQLMIVKDRYSLKAPQTTAPTIGQQVLVITDTHTRQMGCVTHAHPEDNTYTVILQNDQTVTVPRSRIDIPLETITDVMRRVAKSIARGEESMQADFEDALLNAEFIPGGRVLAMAGSKSNKSAFNCYVIPSPKDSREGIINSLLQMTHIMATGGGVGINLSSIRPRHSRVSGVDGRASGAVSWGALFSYTTGLIEQAGSRRGALMAMLGVWHPDIQEFINSKRKAGQITNANISVCISDAFMQAVKQDADWELIFPDTTHPDYNWLWEGDINYWRELGHPVIVHNRVKARALWSEIIESAHASAEPGIWFEDQSNYYSNSQYYNRLIATNPCVDGLTRIPSRHGLKRALDIQQSTEIATDARLSNDPTYKATEGTFLTGIKPVCTLSTREGFSLTATPDHLISTPDGWKPLETLAPGDLIHIGNYTSQSWGTYGTYELGQILGWYIGDGTRYENVAVLYFYGLKHALAEQYLDAVNKCIPPLPTEKPHTIWKNPNYDGWRIKSTRLYTLLETMGVNHTDKLHVPATVWSGSKQYVRGFLSALFDADGSVQHQIANGTRTVRLTSISLDLLTDIQLLLLQFNINSRIYRNRSDAKLKLMPDGKGKFAEYWVNAVHELHISKSNLIKFADEIGFTLEHKKNLLHQIITTHNLRQESFTARVESVSPLDYLLPVYDLTEPQTSSFIANGIVVHNCGEQPLPEWGVCNLGAINLARFYDESKQDVDWERLRQTVKTAVTFLDRVIDNTPYVNRQVHDNQIAERRIGLGSMGFAELLIKLKIRYGSDESIAFIDKLFAFIAIAAYRASADLCKLYETPFPNYDHAMLKTPYMQRLFQADPDLESYIHDSGGVANVTLLTQAPTGTTGTMLNTSTGLEPFFSWSYTRSGKLGHHVTQVPLVEEYYAQHPEATTLPDYFVTAMELSPREHVRVQAAFQRWIDSAVSKTCNVPNEYTVEQVAEIYEYMYDMGCKGGTIYRDGSRDEQVLNHTKHTPQLRLGNVCPMCNEDTLEPEGNCQKCINPSCGYSQCAV